MIDDKETRIGKLPPRYTFILNPYTEYRFTRCPDCNEKTKQRKLPLFIHVDPMKPVVLNKTCYYCPDCDLLIAHQDELEEQLAGLFAEQNPSIIGNDYLVLGTVEREAWQAGVKQPKIIPEMLEYLHDFKEVRSVRVRPGGWYPADTAPSELPVLEPTPPDTAWRRRTQPFDDRPDRSEKPVRFPKAERRQPRRRRR
jgi:thiol-disulfide isomerase/thioredoxin